MKKKKMSIVKATVLFVLILSTNVFKAQTSMAPVPATSLGQTFEITSSDPLWNSLIEVSTVSRNTGQTILNNGGDPTDYVSCNGTVCCQTVHYYSASCGCWYFLTKCWAQSDNRELLRVTQVH